MRAQALRRSTKLYAQHTPESGKIYSRIGIMRKGPDSRGVSYNQQAAVVEQEGAKQSVAEEDAEDTVSNLSTELGM